MENVDNIYGKMLEEEILTSRRDPAIPGCIRINVGNREENEKLINLLKSI
jgi:histidinol-phosphate aminotransferase